MKRTISAIRTFLKLLLAFFLLITILQMVTLFYENIVEAVTSNEEQRQQQRLLEYTAADRYGDLYDELTLYDLYEDTYQPYWDVAEAYHLYCQYLAASQASASCEDAAKKVSLETRAAELCTELLAFPDISGNPTAQAAVQRIQAKCSAK